MIVLVTTACPASLRGDITRWLFEISAGVYVGRLSARVRDALWDRIIAQCGTGKVLMIQTARTETGFTVRQHQYDWNLRDFDGITLWNVPMDWAIPLSRFQERLGGPWLAGGGSIDKTVRGNSKTIEFNAIHRNNCR